MADVIPEARGRRPSDAATAEPETAPALSEEQLYWYIEALFFAYRDFTSEPDRILDEIRFGRAHHRVLHFVDRYPGMRVAGLLDILQITKQSLARVLRELIKEGYVEQQPGKEDKRERHLYATERGAALARRLSSSQLGRIGEALAEVGPEGQRAVAEFLGAMFGHGDLSPYTQNGRTLTARGRNPMVKE
jgi:DNA-binding MarR family transcriptional regulator